MSHKLTKSFLVNNDLLIKVTFW